MGPAERTTLKCLVLSDSLRQSFSVRHTSTGSSRPRTLHLVHVVRNSVGILLNLICVLCNVTYVSHNSHIGFRQI